MTEFESKVLESLNDLKTSTKLNNQELTMVKEDISSLKDETKAQSESFRELATETRSFEQKIVHLEEKALGQVEILKDALDNTQKEIDDQKDNIQLLNIWKAETGDLSKLRHTANNAMQHSEALSIQFTDHVAAQKTLEANRKTLTKMLVDNSWKILFLIGSAFSAGYAMIKIIDK